MEVVAVCRSKGKMRKRTASILDAYLFRIGDRTWRGRCSMECLRRISKDLKGSASRNMSVAVYRSGSKEEQQRPLFVVGSKSRFSEEGRCPIAVRSRAPAARISGHERFVRAAVEVAALFHDVGKATNLFQSKLKAAIRKEKVEKGAVVRHEVFSTLVLAGILDGAATAEEVAVRLKHVAKNPAIIDEACDFAGQKCLELHRAGNREGEVLSSRELGDPHSLRAQLLLLVLSHHRLADIDHAQNSVMMGNHIFPDQSLSEDGMKICPEQDPFWHEEWFSSRLASAAESLEAGKDGIAYSAMDLFGRFPMMMADHIGSSESMPGTADGHLANTIWETGEPADSLSKHVQRVTRAVRPMVAGVFRQRWQFPVIAPEGIADRVRRPTFAGNRFDWQVAASQAAGRVASSGNGGFFGTLIAGTGSGKTRAAAMVMSALAEEESDPSRRGLRFNLALPLRTLTRQSGAEYVQDLGFRPEDVATFVGGGEVIWNEREDEGDSDGSEDRLALFAEGAVDDFSNEDLGMEISTLGGEGGRLLPSFAHRLCEGAGASERRLFKFLAAPIVVSTIDHLMRAASPTRGQHIDQMLRVSTSDLVIDELDQFSEEDLSAVRRLVRLAGLSGRRVLIMSATLPRDLAESFYETYHEAYASYARMNGETGKVHFLCAGESLSSCLTSGGAASFSETYDECVAAISRERPAGKAIQVAEILDVPRDWEDQVDIICHAADQLHARHSLQVSGMGVSVGLVRITRVAHLQALAVSLNGREDPGVHREYVVLHASLPQVQRSFIEKQLKRWLTRKGAAPNSEIEAMLEDRGILARARAEGASSIQIIVLSSPVIETGNDVDFDWLIVDPSSIRSVIQACGRVNRHRRSPVDEPNIAILGRGLISLEAGAMKMPGPETEPAKGTGVKPFVIEGSRDSLRMFGGRGAFEINSSLVMDHPVFFSDVEKEVRQRFLRVHDRDAKEELFIWSSRFGSKHRFRRQSAPEILAFALAEDEEVSWQYFPSHRSKEAQELHIETPDYSVFESENMFWERLPELLRDAKGFREGRLLQYCSLSVVTGIAEGGKRPVLDPVLGLLRSDEVAAGVNFF